MSDHDSNGDDDFMEKTIPNSYGSGDLTRTQPMRKHTMTYSIVDEAEAKRRHGGSASSRMGSLPLAPTEEMVAMLPLVPVSPINIISAPPATTVKDIVNQLIERDLLAWTALPQDFKDMMLTEPAKFTIIPNAVVGGMPHISYVGVEFMWDGSDTWRLVGLRK